MNIIEHLQWRYATKKFDASHKLSNNQLHTLKQAFNLTATSFGLQTISLVVIEDKNIRQSLVAHAYNQKQVLEASHLFVICIQNNILEADINAYYDTIKNIRQTPDEVLKPFHDNLIKTINNKSIEQRQQWSKNQAYIALGNLMTVCATQKIDACPMEGFIPEKFNQILDLDAKGLQSVLLLPVGARAKDDMFSELKKVRKPLTDTVIEI